MSEERRFTRGVLLVSVALIAALVLAAGGLGRHVQELTTDTVDRERPGQILLLAQYNPCPNGRCR